MKSQGIARVIALSGLSATSLYAAQPSNPGSVLSDGFYNTAMGPGTLSQVTPPAPRQCVPFALNQANPYMNGCGNTASGFAALALDTAGAANTADGAGALYSNTSASYNTAVGTLALFRNSGGSLNTALGSGALFANITGSLNTAAGGYSLFSNSSGTGNTAGGYTVLYFNSTGSENTGVGDQVLYSNTSGSGNTATGAFALNYNLAGSGNVAVGFKSLYKNLDSTSTTSSSYNTAIGFEALYNNTTATAGAYNVAVGFGALYNNGGINNVAVGASALFANTTGIGNTAIGHSAGSVPATGNYNTYVGFGVAGAPTDNYVTSIGVSTLDPNVSGTPTTFISGIWATGLTGSTAPVYVNASGQLGVVPSSERYKSDVAALGEASGKLAQLRPVSFHLRYDPQGAVQYGLIAEEVDRVYPELVIRDRDGRIQGVRYDELAPMLVNEMQRQQATIAAQGAEIHDLEAQNEVTQRQLAELRGLRQELQAALRELKAPGSIVAQR